MPVLQPASIKQITRILTEGDSCFVNKRSTQITTIDRALEDPEEIAAQTKLQEELEGKPERYLKIEPMPSKDLLVIMRDFCEEVADRAKRKELSNALNRNNPIRNFKQVIGSDMELNQHWRNYSFEEYQRWVSNFVIDAYNY